MSFAGRIRQGRNKKQFTQKKLAELLDVSRQVVSE